ncbi:MAG: putative transporter YycB [Candidatus Celerinatantimonas neptuna]|nr:MAG: putative transporter YycB [Candidatus Celerinatantimonas neptuna]
MRAPLTSLPSVINDIKADLHIASGLAGLLTTVPVLCFGALTPLASALLHRVGIEKSIFITLFGVIFGSLIRSSDGFTLALIGTIIIGASLTLGNIVSLLIIARDFYTCAGLMTSIYVMAMSIGATMSAALTVPMTSIMGWRAALSFWSILALIGVILSFCLQMSRKRANQARKGIVTQRESDHTLSSSLDIPPIQKVWRKKIVWLLTTAFACQAFIFYAMTAWLPDYLIYNGHMNIDKAGSIAATFQILGIVGCLGVPYLNSVLRFSHAKLFVVVATAWFLMPVGFLIDIHFWPLWILAGGIGAGGGFSVIFTLVMIKAKNLQENRQMSSFVQGGGYIVASTSPTVIGFFHQITNNWSVSFILLSCTAIVMGISGIISTRLSE